MALLQQWKDKAYSETANKQELQELWSAYFVKEKDIYAQLLKDPDTAVKGTVKELADKYNAVFVPYFEKFQEALKIAPPEHWSVDCIHATNAGHEIMARAWLEYVTKAGFIEE